MFPGWSFVGANDMKRGAQDISDSFAGMCVTFSLYYSLLRLTNPNESPMQIYEYMNERARKGKLGQDVLRLNKYASTMLSKLSRHELDNVRTRSRRQSGS